jgi:hypothetical protein
MSNNGAGAPKAVVPFAPKLDGNFDQLDKAGHAVLDAVRQAAGAAETKYYQTTEANRKLSARRACALLSAAEGRGWRASARAIRNCRLQFFSS